MPPIDLTFVPDQQASAPTKQTSTLKPAADGLHLQDGQTQKPAKDCRVAIEKIFRTYTAQIPDPNSAGC